MDDREAEFDVVLAVEGCGICRGEVFAEPTVCLCGASVTVVAERVPPSLGQIVTDV